MSPEKKTCTNNEEIPSPTLTKTREVPGFTPSSSNRWSNDLNYVKSRERRYRQEQKFRRRHSISSSGLSEDREADVSENDDEEVPLSNKYVHGFVFY